MARYQSLGSTIWFNVAIDFCPAFAYPIRLIRGLRRNSSVGEMGKGCRIDMEASPPAPEPIPDSFENVVKASVKPVVPKEPAKENKPR